MNIQPNTLVSESGEFGLYRQAPSLFWHLTVKSTAFCA
jgi:hypothetical protein